MASRLTLSLGVNFVGRFFAGVVSLVVTPLYLKRLGAESYGLIGSYTLVLAILNFANVGLADAANREAARGQSGAQTAGTLRAYGWVAWLTGLVVWFLLTATSGWVAQHWLNAEQLSVVTVQQSLNWMAVLVGLQVPFDFYVGVGLGAQRAGTANAFLVSLTTLRGAAGLGVLWWWPPSPVSFFISQVAVSLVVVVWAAVDFTRHVPAAAHAPVLQTWRAGWKLPAGMAGVALTSMLIGQLDRFTVSRTLTLEDFGYYSIAITLANSLYFLIGPIQAAYFPEFSRHAGAGDEARLGPLYHQACQRMAMMVMPVGAILVFFAHDVVALWTSRPATADAIAPLVAFLVGSRLIGALNTLPYSLQFAHGWTSLVLRANLLAIVTLAPGVVLLARAYGAVGASAGYFLLSIPFLFGIAWRMHRRLLPGQLGAWVLRDNLPFVALAFGVAAAGKLLQPEALSAPARLAWLAGASLLTLVATVGWHAPTREALRRRLGGPAVATSA